MRKVARYSLIALVLGSLSSCVSKMKLAEAQFR